MITSDPAGRSQKEEFRCNHSDTVFAGIQETTIREEKQTQTQTFGPDIFGWGGGLPCEGVGAKKFGMSLETREIKLFWRDPRILPGYPGGAPKV